MTWTEAPPPPGISTTPLGWLRAILRGGALGVLTFGGLVVLLALRLIEAPLCGARRPVTPWIVQGVCRLALIVIGLRADMDGRPTIRPGVIVANHASWLDIFVLNACDRAYFVAKAEVADWAGIGWLARATGTLFIARDRRAAQAQTELFAQRLGAGHRLLFFPEGTSTDGLRVLPFKPTLLAAVFDPLLANDLWVQPVTIAYTSPAGVPSSFYGWWGDMDFGPHLLRVLAVRRQGRVRVRFHPPLRVADFAHRKALACRAETMVRAGLDAALSRAP